MERPLPEFPFEALLDFLYTRGLDEAALRQVAETAQRELAARGRAP